MVSDFLGTFIMGLSEVIPQILQGVRDECRYSLCPSTEAWTRRLWSILTINVVQPERKAVLTQPTARMKPEGIMLSDISQTQKNKCLSPLIQGPRAVGSIDTESRIVGSGRGRGLSVLQDRSSDCARGVHTACTAAAFGQLRHGSNQTHMDRRMKEEVTHA